MNLHQKLKSIETQRGHEVSRSASKTTRNWDSPIQEQVTKRRKLSLNSELKKNDGSLAKRGPLEIGLIDRTGVHESIIEHSMSIQTYHLKRVLESRIEEIKSELCIR